MKKLLAAGSLGFIFGAVLLVLGFMSAGTGHGCYAPIGLAAGPATLISLKLRDAVAAFVGPPVLWTVYGVLSAWWGRSGRAAARGRKLLLLHNAVGLLVISPVPGTEYADWGHFGRVWPVALLGLLVYAAGQYAAWRLLPRLDAGR
jgi:hypothetical protein